MADANEKNETPKLNSSLVKDEDESVIAPSTMLGNRQGQVQEQEQEQEQDQDQEDEDEDEDVDEDEDDGEYDEEEEEEDEDGKEPDKEGEDVNNKGRTMVVVNGEGINTNEEHNKGKMVGEEETNKENNVKEDADKAVDEKKPEEQNNGKESGENSEKKVKRQRPRNRNRNRNKNKNKKKVEQKTSDTLAANGDKPESSSKKNAPKRVESMGMVFMCSSKTKTDCFRYKILGLPASKKDQVAKIYKGMRLFLFDVDLRLMYGIFKAAGPGGYNLEPKAFNKGFPSQVRYTVLDDCLPVPEEKFKKVIKENYYARNKFEGLLKAEQVKKLCKLFKRPTLAAPHEPVERRRKRADDAPISRGQKRRKNEERPRGREKRRYTDYERPPVLYKTVPRYQPPPPAVRSYGYERGLDPYLAEQRGYRVVDVEAREGYHVYGREGPPPYREAVYTLPPEYRVVSGRDYLPAEYGYRDVGVGVPPPATDYRSRPTTHYRY